MSKKWWLLLAAMFACVVVACVFLFPKPDELKVAFDRVEKGMSQEEVEALFGGRSLRQSGYKTMINITWTNKNGDSARIGFVDYVVTDKVWSDSTTTWMARLRRWLGLQDR